MIALVDVGSVGGVAPGDSRTTAEAQSRLSSLIQQHPLASFFVLSFAIAWILWLPVVVTGDGAPAALDFVLVLVGSLVPSTVAIVLVAMLYGKAGVRTLLRRLLVWRIGIGWWVAVALLAALGVVAVGLSVLLGGESPDVEVAIPAVVILFAFSIFPGSAGGEEIGWRGFALPHLQARRSALGASILLGVGWGVWHFPLYLTGQEIRPLALFPAWVVLTVAFSVILTWLYNSTRGNLPIVIVSHAACNLPLTVLLEPLDDKLAQPFLIYLALLVLAASVVVAATGRATLSRTGDKQVAVP